MPIHAYRCRTCGAEFQTLVRSGDRPACEVCQSIDLDQQIALIAAPNKGGESSAEGAQGMGCGACGEAACPAFGES
ncbi:FmdB family zinc ribbon protein [Methylocapsa palsarum]|uniref:Putative regulatory protein, FmdB family n=1 Tax=Methylocapsa palsarum TaxID=1612308 RepID=A0A1I3XZ68_9HYPH|nr:zinc ribbon domain-containing protein [Methylocapsa palsarum]SFK24868.1 putative regulatory protein, FmdB family [Methylocapsa palsarum]